MSRILDAIGRLLPARALRPEPRHEEKASAVGPLIAWEPLGQPVWSPRDYTAFAREGFMQNAIVYRSVRMIAEAAASVPLLLYEGDAEIEGHPLIDLMAHPSPDHTSADFLEAWYGFLLVAGNAYVEAVAVSGRLRELYVLRPDRMKVIPGPNGWPEAFEYSANGTSVRFAEEPLPGVRRILHTRLFHPDNDHYGMSPIEAAATSIDIHNAAGGWNKALLDNSARPSGALVYAAKNGNLTNEQFGRLRSELEAAFQGARNAGRPMLLEGGLDWKPLSMSPKDMDFIAAKHAAARDIALALGVPPMLLGIPGDNTYANYQEAQRAFWRGTVLPLVNRMAKAFSAWLAPAYGGGLDLRPDLDQVEGLSAEREALWARIDKASFLTLDEKRAAVGYGPAPREEAEPAPAPSFGGEGTSFDGAGDPSAGSGPPAHFVKYAPDQPRVSAGSSGGGQWSSGGGGSSGRVRVAQADTGTRNDAGPEFDPSRRGWHEYTVTNEVCAAELRCSKEEIADQLARYSVPGIDAAQPATNGSVYLVEDPRNGLRGGYVRTLVTVDGLRIVNRTLPVHVFYDGQIERVATQSPDGSWHVTTRGTGNNILPGAAAINEQHGPEIFDRLDRTLKENIERHHGVQGSKSDIAGVDWAPDCGGCGGSAPHG
ncbi:MAG: phage portal protein [Hyphomicrobium sp.]